MSTIITIVEKVRVRYIYYVYNSYSFNAYFNQKKKGDSCLEGSVNNCVCIEGSVNTWGLFDRVIKHRMMSVGLL